MCVFINPFMLSVLLSSRVTAKNYRLLAAYILKMLLANSKDPDQTGRMLKLVLIFAGLQLFSKWFNILGTLSINGLTLHTLTVNLYIMNDQTFISITIHNTHSYKKFILLFFHIKQDLTKTLVESIHNKHRLCMHTALFIIPAYSLFQYC